MRASGIHGLFAPFRGTDAYGWEMRSFVVTGCGRSGTMYTAEVLRAAGVRCGHEQVFTPRGPRLEVDGLDGDSSWLSVPHLDRLPPDTLVLHQLRAPMAVIRSWVAKGRFRRWHPEGSLPKHVAKRLLRRPPGGLYAYRQYIRHHAPAVFAERSEADRAARYWLLWNEMAEANARHLDYHRYWVHQMDEPFLRGLLRQVGAEEARVDAALASVAKDTNTDPCLEAPPFELSPRLQEEVEAAAARWASPTPAFSA